MAEILSIAVFEPLEGKEEEALETLRGLIGLLAEKEYSRDSLPRKRRARTPTKIRRYTATGRGWETWSASSRCSKPSTWSNYERPLWAQAPPPVRASAA